MKKKTYNFYPTLLAAAVGAIISLSAHAAEEPAFTVNALKGIIAALILD